MTTLFFYRHLDDLAKKGSILFQLRNSNEWITSVAGPDHIVADLDSRDKKI